jgi:aconitate hydratase
MGVLPLQFADGATAAGLGLDGRETFAIRGLSGGIVPGARVRVEASTEDGRVAAFEAVVRIDGPAEIEYFRAGGILRMVLRQLLAG